jgi:formate hydrogenlyase maturation protein HycH
VPERVLFYQLDHKFVDSSDTPPESQHIVYYPLTIGHHVGVLDCFSSVMEVGYSEFCAWIDRLPEGPAQRKLAGVTKWGEIEINTTHVGDLSSVLQTALPSLQAQEKQWTLTFLRLLKHMTQEPAIYLMVRAV